jgi:hypothetical protein
MAVSDTIPLKDKSDKIRTLTVAPLFAEAIKRVHGHESISSLFVIFLVFFLHTSCNSHNYRFIFTPKFKEAPELLKK